ncbi:MAG TPA: methyltransferase domain-containing protein [Stellaceae bacterium]|nr:methyltransferase domain-containing protein [Stellaceae bacterium]
MAVFESLTPAERARQLGNPEGTIGIAVAKWLNENNRQSNAKIVAMLGLAPGNYVLEIGFGNGRIVPDIIAQAADVRYAGIDISATMVEEATRFNAALADAGRVRFHCGSAERLPFAEDSFDRVFSIGVIHFWAEPIAPLVEVRRVLRHGGISLMGCLHPRTAPDFARPEHGFHLRDAAGWTELYRAAGFTEIGVETVETQQINPDGMPTTRYGFRITASG